MTTGRINQISRCARRRRARSDVCPWYAATARPYGEAPPRLWRAASDQPSAVCAARGSDAIESAVEPERAGRRREERGGRDPVSARLYRLPAEVAAADHGSLGDRPPFVRRRAALRLREAKDSRRRGRPRRIVFGAAMTRTLAGCSLVAAATAAAVPTRVCVWSSLVRARGARRGGRRTACPRGGLAPIRYASRGGHFSASDHRQSDFCSDQKRAEFWRALSGITVYIM